jgi:deoxycytidylate deaminase/dephospho-CoA kinase
MNMDTISTNVEVLAGDGTPRTIVIEIPKLPPDWRPEYITAEVPIIGFTGALGSGCTFFAEGLARFHEYYHVRLSDPIHDFARKHAVPESFHNLQNIGNKIRSAVTASGLVWMALQKADEEWHRRHTSGLNNLAGVAIDGIRNLGEVAALRYAPHFFLFSIQAVEEVRSARLIRDGRCRTREEFAKVNDRDEEERGRDGQQIKLCNYHSDVVILNDDNIPRDIGTKYEDHIREYLFDKYVRHIQNAAQGRPADYYPSDRETLMTAAYVISKRSKCLKRKVGAVIATKEGDIISTGYNNVPRGTIPCVEDPSLNQCARDLLQEEIGKKFKVCPNCGKAITFSNVECPRCLTKLSAFTKKCPNCHKDPEIEYRCSCGVEVYETFLAGRKMETGKLLDVCRSLHAEENAILNLRRTGGIIPPSAVLYSTTFPCNLCANKIVSVDVDTVVFCEPYITKEATSILEAKGAHGHKVTVDRFQGVKSVAFFKLCD